MRANAPVDPHRRRRLCKRSLLRTRRRRVATVQRTRVPCAFAGGETRPSLPPPPDLGIPRGDTRNRARNNYRVIDGNQFAGRGHKEARFAGYAIRTEIRKITRVFPPSICRPAKRTRPPALTEGHYSRKRRKCGSGLGGVGGGTRSTRNFSFSAVFSDRATYVLLGQTSALADVEQMFYFFVHGVRSITNRTD